MADYIFGGTSHPIKKRQCIWSERTVQAVPTLPDVQSAGVISPRHLGYDIVCHVRLQII